MRAINTASESRRAVAKQAASLEAIARKQADRAEVAALLAAPYRHDTSILASLSYPILPRFESLPILTHAHRANCAA